MGTGSSQKIKVTITGDIQFDYEDEVMAYEIFKQDLALLCAKYNLQYDYKELYEK